MCHESCIDKSDDAEVSDPLDDMVIVAIPATMFWIAVRLTEIYLRIVKVLKHVSSFSPARNHRKATLGGIFGFYAVIGGCTLSLHAVHELCTKYAVEARG
jgi:hypothetical protein